MNLSVAGMSWFSNIYRKFESVCEDVDEVMNNESIKYIRKVQYARENVMKFYSKLAEVIVSPIIDPDISEEEDVDTPTHMSISSSLQYVGLVHKSDDSEESAFGGSAASECLSPTSSYIYASDADDADDVESTLLPNKAFADYNTALHNDGIDIIKEYSEYINSQIDSDSNYSSTLVSSIQSFGPLDEFGNCETNYFFNKETNDLCHHMELEESCVIVDFSTPHDDDDDDDDDVSIEAPKQPSYKKMILEPFSSKKRLAKEYKEHCRQGTSLLAPHTMLLRDSQPIQSSDFEWELL